MKKTKDSAVKARKHPLSLNVAIPKDLVEAAGDLLGALIIDFIYYCFKVNGRKPVWLKIDAIHKMVPSLQRSAVDKKLNKLVKAGQIIKKKGEGKHYHKVWYSPSPSIIGICGGKNPFQSGKVYYNPSLAEENPQASIVYAAIANLLKMNVGFQTRAKPGSSVMGKDLGRVDDKLLLDTEKLADGSGLSIKQVRKAVAWLIKNKKIEAAKVFGNKKRVWLPPKAIPTADPNSAELATESFPHGSDEDLTEY